MESLVPVPSILDFSYQNSWAEKTKKPLLMVVPLSPVVFGLFFFLQRPKGTLSKMVLSTTVILALFKHWTLSSVSIFFIHTGQQAILVLWAPSTGMCEKKFLPVRTFLRAEIWPQFLRCSSHCSSFSCLLFGGFPQYSSLDLRRLPQNRLHLGQKWQTSFKSNLLSRFLTKPIEQMLLSAVE